MVHTLRVHLLSRLTMKILRPYIDIFFPAVCACCGSALRSSNHHLCLWCKKKRFERAESEGFQILPDSVQFQFAMWSFDKGGYLQDLLHDLKYNCLRSVGEELGRTLAGSFLRVSKSEMGNLFEQSPPVIVPVPLHKSKLRKRGYNQAEALARGFSEISGWTVAATNAVVRVKKTTTQTGLTAEKRAENLKNAFRLNKPKAVAGKIPIIIDDVFTTGATTFELAKVLKECTEPAVIATVAKA